MKEYVKLFVKLLKWVIMNLLISPLLKRYFEAPMVEFLVRIFGDRVPESGQVPEDDVESASGGSACALGGSAV